MATSWHEDDEFWRITEPVLFPSHRVKSAAAEARCASKLLKLEPGARILDLCCGVGRHSIELAHQGFAVTAVDRTGRYLERARARAKREGVEIEFVEDDARSFCRPDTFDGAVNLFTSFGYFEDEGEDELVARNLATSLKPGSVLVMDIMSKEIISRDFEERGWREEDSTLILEERALTKDFSIVINRWIIIPEDGPKSELNFLLRIYSATELKSLFERAGFSHTKALGSLEGRAYDHKAERLVLVATK